MIDRVLPAPLPALGPTTELRSAFAMFPSGVIAVCGLVDAAPCGLAASSFTSVSLEPALVSICVAKSSTTWPELSRAPKLGLSVLGADHEQSCRALASKTGDRFADLDWRHAPSGAIFVADAALWLECSVADTISAGDHDIVVFAVDAIQAHPHIDPLVFHGSAMHRLARSTVTLA
jgi:flavin reductase (DIM6/NTAB) family NADH-FMN oxidoreductase RutF